MTLDATKLPRASAYVRSLPHGFASFPECRIKGDTFDGILDDFPGFLEHAIPPEIERVLRHPPSWVPETIRSCTSLVIRDLFFSSDHAFLAWNRENLTKIYRRPAYRMLMFVMSPSLVAMGAASRWDAFHQGTWLRGRPSRKDERTGRRSIQLELETPPGLFAHLSLLVFREAFSAALEAAGARGLRADDPTIDGRIIGYNLSWDP